MAEKLAAGATESLPVPLAIRLLLDSVSYSNPLPDWFVALGIDYGAREVAINRRIRAYLGGVRPEPPFVIELPRKTGEMKPWSLPSVNDQIVLQACVSSIAQALFERCVDRRRVFSYRYQRNPDVLALTEDPISSWRAFQDETRRRCSSGSCVLQLDLKDTFRSIDRSRFYGFLRGLFSDKWELDLLEIMIDSFADGRGGLPLVNDSIFFLGNAYLTVVDGVMARRSQNFIRFVDDYRIFGESKTELEHLAAAVAPELAALGFRVNTEKSLLSTGEEYLESLSRVRYARRETDGAVAGDAAGAGLDPKLYPGSTVAFAGIIPPDAMVAQIRAALDEPRQKLNEGRGRFLAGSLRRARLDALVVDGHSDGDNGRPSLHRHFVGQLSRNRPLIDEINLRLKQFAAAPDEAWRLVWLLYLSEDIDPRLLDRRASSLLRHELSRIRASRSVPTVAHLWAENVRLAAGGRPSRQVPSRPEIEKLHELSYIKSGELLAGVARNG